MSDADAIRILRAALADAEAVLEELSDSDPIPLEIAAFARAAAERARDTLAAFPHEDDSERIRGISSRLFRPGPPGTQPSASVSSLGMSTPPASAGSAPSGGDQ